MMDAHRLEVKLFTPFVTEKDAAELVLRLYSIKAIEVKELDSYMDRAFVVRSAPGKGIDGQTDFILKVLNTDETTDPPDTVAVQMKVLDHLRQFPELKCQVPVPTVDGKLLSYEMLQNDSMSNGIVTSRKGLSAVRMFVYLQGQPLDDVAPVPSEFFYKMGQHIGDLQHALQTYPGNVEPLKEKANVCYWFSENIQQIKHHLQVVEDPLRRALVEEVIDETLGTVTPIQEDLRKGIVVYDCSHWNLLVRSADSANGTKQSDKTTAGDFEISGIIDFDTMVHTALVYEIAVSMMYLMLCSDSPLECTAHLLAGFESRAPLSQDERHLLRVLIAGRFVYSLIYGLVLHKAQPQNASILSSQVRGWECLELLWKKSSEDLMNLWDKIKRLYE
ncbi:hydroxylysine kinase-like [Patiria miniata]|uniref:Hydroxylysine kinase n=1 Tax=Patiria miniata TaxID=46514 RepID=A0A913YY77_PATMI|nr:hydroxylysine kinase-like [Patiria miniata]XP_038044705.1 hydroxylysine kinase-like [Patiria miniata]XP_038044706.1 hydroxylysine kinase-like [Patiria miniata]XP_038044707.1 hydroxylysine kinase-like [Patiria miniata]